MTSFSRQKPLKSKNKNHTILWNEKFYHCAKSELYQIKHPKVIPRCHFLPSGGPACSGGVQNHETKSSKLGTIVTSFPDSKLRKKAISLSLFFLLRTNQFAKKWYNSALFIRKCRKNLFFARLGVLKELIAQNYVTHPGY